MKVAGVACLLLALLAISCQAGRLHIAKPNEVVQLPNLRGPGANERLDELRSRALLTPFARRSLAATNGSDDDASTGLPTEADVLALFDTWNAALATGDPKNVVALYTSDAVLEPTLSNQIRYNSSAIEDYFVHFLAKKPIGKINEHYVRILSPIAALNSGIYTFTLTDPVSKNVSDVMARYTFLYELVNGTWLIEFHHSSAMPEPGVEAQILMAYKAWADAVLSGDPEKVADLYAIDHGVTLEPTLSNTIRTDRAGLVDYFTHFLAKGPTPYVNQGVVHSVGPNVAAYLGVYTFDFADGSSATARFSLTYQLIDGKWLIMDHHSSQMPEQPITPANTYW